MKGIPEHIRSDNGPEFVAEDLRKWLADTGARTLYIEPGSPWENGYCESFNSKLRDEFLNGEIFYSMKEVHVLAERWRVHYNTVRPHSSLGYRPPAPAAWLTEDQHGAWKSGKQRTLPTFPHPDDGDGLYLHPRRYTNNVTGTKHRAGHFANPAFSSQMPSNSDRDSYDANCDGLKRDWHDDCYAIPRLQWQGRRPAVARVVLASVANGVRHGADRNFPSS